MTQATKFCFSMVMTLCYDAISRNVNGLGYSPFVVFTVTSSTILPACLFILAVQDKVGRKALASGSLLLSGIFTACSGVILALVRNPEPMLIVPLAVIARLGINVAYNSGKTIFWGIVIFFMKKTIYVVARSI